MRIKCNIREYYIWKLVNGITDYIFTKKRERIITHPKF